MPSKFGGIPVESGSKFGGLPVTEEAPAKPERSGYWRERLTEAKALGDGIRHSLANTALGVGDLLGLVDDQQVQQFRNDRDATKQRYQSQAPRAGGFFGGGEFVGDALQAAVPLGAAGAGVKLSNYARAAGAGAAFGATRPTVAGESRGMNTAVGAGANALGVGLGHAIGAAGKVAPQFKRDVFNAAQDRGIPLTAAQMSDSPFVKRMARMSDNLPFSGSHGRSEAQVRAFNKAVADRIGAKVNDDGFIDAGVTAQRFEEFGPQFDAVFKDGMEVDAPFIGRIGEIWKRAEGMDGPAQANVDIWIRRLQEQGRDGKLSGDTLRSLDRQLREAGAGGSDRALLAREFRNELHEAFGRQAPPGLREAWDGLRGQYKDYLSVESLVARNPEGPLPPAQLYGAVTRNAKGKNDVTRGRSGELAELGMIGRQMRGPSSSGTAENVQTAATGMGLMANPGSTLALLLSGNTLGRALNSNMLARLLMKEGRGQIAPLAPYARPLPFLLGGPAYSGSPEGP